jgi:hypothetical protein
MKDINIVSLALYLIGASLVVWHIVHRYSFEHWHGFIGFLILSIAYGIHTLLDERRE